MRPIPEICEVIGTVGVPTKNPSRCSFRAVMAVCVETDSPLYTCKSHSKDMRKFWGTSHAVTTVPI